MPLIDTFLGIVKSESVLPEDMASLQARPIQEQYAILCAVLGKCSDSTDTEYQQMYEAGLHDYARLWKVDGVAGVTINWKNHSVLVGTKCIDVLDNLGLREIGEFILTLSPIARAFKIENITRTIPPVNGCHHPHVSSAGAMCISDGRQEIMFAMAGRKFSYAVQIIIRGLYMHPSEVDAGTAYSPLRNWPFKSEVAQ